MEKCFLNHRVSAKHKNTLCEPKVQYVHLPMSLKGVKEYRQHVLLFVVSLNFVLDKSLLVHWRNKCH